MWWCTIILNSYFFQTQHYSIAPFIRVRNLNLCSDSILSCLIDWVPPKSNMWLYLVLYLWLAFKWLSCKIFFAVKVITMFSINIDILSKQSAMGYWLNAFWLSKNNGNSFYMHWDSLRMLTWTLAMYSLSPII